MILFYNSTVSWVLPPRLQKWLFEEIASVSVSKNFQFLHVLMCKAGVYIFMLFLLDRKSITWNPLAQSSEMWPLHVAPEHLQSLPTNYNV